MPLNKLTQKRVEQAEEHFLNGLQILKTMIDTAEGELKINLQRAINELELSETPYDSVMQYIRRLNNKAVDNAPQFVATCIVELPKEDRGLDRSIVRINTSRMDQSRQDKNAFFRRQPLKLHNSLTGQFIIRMPMGGGGLKGLSKDSIALDYDAVDALGIRGNFINGQIEAELVVSRANAVSLIQYYWDHPETGYRVSMRLSMIGLVLGLIAFIPMLFGIG